MTTDNEAREWLLQRLYNQGYRYLARDKSGIIDAHKTRPKKFNTVWSSDYCVRHFNETFDIFDDIQWTDEEPLDIAKELGIIDWSKVPVDTKVLVSSDGTAWSRKYFHEYSPDNDYPFFVFDFGRTSWTTTGSSVGYKYCKLAEEGMIDEY